MKKLALTIVSALAMTGAAFAQGTINWSGGGFVPTAITVETNASQYFGGSPAGGSVGPTATAAGGFYYELLYNTAFTGSQVAQPSLAALTDGSWIDTGLTATNTGTAGRILPVASSTQATVPGWAGGIGAGGTTNNIVLVGWSANLGTSWSAVQSVLGNWATEASVIGPAFFGESNTGYIVPNIFPAPGAHVFASVATVNGLPINSVNMQLYLMPLDLDLNMTPTPEPSTMALIGLSGLSLLLFRRRKQ